MRKLILLFLAISLTVILGCSGCSGTLPAPVAPVSAQTTCTVTQGIEIAQKSLYASGAALEATPKFLDILYAASKMTKQEYNDFVPKYNQALAAFKVAVNVLNTAKAIGADPANYPAYTIALADFMGKKANVDNLLAAFGGAQ